MLRLRDRQLHALWSLRGSVLLPTHRSHTSSSRWFGLEGGFRIGGQLLWRGLGTHTASHDVPEQTEAGQGAFSHPCRQFLAFVRPLWWISCGTWRAQYARKKINVWSL